MRKEKFIYLGRKWGEKGEDCIVKNINPSLGNLNPEFEKNNLI